MSLINVREFFKYQINGSSTPLLPITYIQNSSDTALISYVITASNTSNQYPITVYMQPVHLNEQTKTTESVSWVRVEGGLLGDAQGIISFSLNANTKPVNSPPDPGSFRYVGVSITVPKVEDNVLLKPAVITSVVQGNLNLLDPSKNIQKVNSTDVFPQERQVTVGQTTNVSIVNLRNKLGQIVRDEDVTDLEVTIANTAVLGFQNNMSAQKLSNLRTGFSIFGLVGKQQGTTSLIINSAKHMVQPYTVTFTSYNPGGPPPPPPPPPPGGPPPPSSPPPASPPPPQPNEPQPNEPQPNSPQPGPQPPSGPLDE